MVLRNLFRIVALKKNYCKTKIWRDESRLTTENQIIYIFNL